MSKGDRTYRDFNEDSYKNILVFLHIKKEQGMGPPFNHVSFVWVWSQTISLMSGPCPFSTNGQA